MCFFTVHAAHVFDIFVEAPTRMSSVKQCQLYEAAKTMVIIKQSIWVNLITTEPCSPEPWESWLLIGKSSPSMAELFSLVSSGC